MSARQKKGVLGMGALALAAALVISALGLYGRAAPGASGAAELPGAGAGVRITLIARGMAFIRPEQPDQPNPTLILPPRSAIEIELRNDEPGSRHNVAIAELQAESPVLRAGQSTVLRFTTPASGELTYYCTPHPLMMRGRIVIE